ncbi:S-layer protein [Methanothermococcus sp. SCGC AD-155-C09]|nr:S-layer protein [Methanothermococcus sp. SCGC AD-155-C09]
MKNTVKIYMLIFTLSFLLVNCTLASDATPPQLPAQYYGKVISPNPLNGYIEVKIGDKNYGSIPLVNNTFGGPTYSDGKLLVYAPGQDGTEVKFYLNGGILLNTSDNICYNTGDIRYIKLYYNIDIEKLEILNKFIVPNDEENMLKIIDINNISNYSIGNLEILEISLKDMNNTLIIPVVNESLQVNFTEIIENINKALEVAKGIQKKIIKDESDIKEVVKNIANNITPVSSLNFKIENITEKPPKKVGNKVISTISFKAVNTSSQKGFITVWIPIGNMTVENITIYNGTNTTTLKENYEDSKIGWYRLLTDGVLEITVIKDPEINVTLFANLSNSSNESSGPSGSGGSDTSSGDSSSSESGDESSSGRESSGSGGGDTSSGGGSSSGSGEFYSDIASDIKSEKIKEIVHKAKVIVGSEIDKDLSAKDLKTTLDLTNKPLEIKEDCILIGGPVANPIVNKYLQVFPVKVSNEYPGKNKGVIQTQKINGHMVILLAGSDRWGTKAAVEYFKTLEDIPEEPIFVEWKDEKAFKINKP